MKDDLLELICLTKLYIYENHNLGKPKQKPNSAPPAFIQAEPKIASPKTEPILAPAKEPNTLTIEEEPVQSITVKRDFSDLEKVFSTELPYIKILKQPLDDSIAKESKKDIFACIVTSEESAKELNFLKNVAASISCRFGKTFLLNIKDLRKDPQAKMILATKNAANALDKSYSHAIILDDIQHYFKNPSFKVLLWQTINDFAKK